MGVRECVGEVIDEDHHLDLVVHRIVGRLRRTECLAVYRARFLIGCDDGRELDGVWNQLTADFPARPRSGVKIQIGTARQQRGRITAVGQIDESGCQVVAVPGVDGLVAQAGDYAPGNRGYAFMNVGRVEGVGESFNCDNEIEGVVVHIVEQSCVAGGGGRAARGFLGGVKGGRKPDDAGVSRREKSG